MLIWNQMISPRGVLQQLFIIFHYKVLALKCTKVKFYSFTTIKDTNTQFLAATILLQNEIIISDTLEYVSWCISANVGTWIPKKTFFTAHSYLSRCFSLDKLWVDPVGRGDHLWDRLDFFVLLTGEPKQYVLFTVLRLQELPESYLSAWKSQRVSKQWVYIQPERKRQQLNEIPTVTLTRWNQKRLSPLQPRTLSTDSLQVSTSSSGSLGKQHNLPLKRASRSITSPVICELHISYPLKTHCQAGSLIIYSIQGDML